jgi:CDP-diacylglycerol---serine O-phosphatidyltransferase
LRLARFNVQTGGDSRYFTGLPSPSAAALIVGLVWVLHSTYGVPGKEVSFIALGFTVFAALSMVSNIRYHSFKHFNVKNRVSFVAVIAVALTFVLISLEPPLVLFLGFLGYAISGPLFAAFRLYQRRGSNRRT